MVSRIVPVILLALLGALHAQLWLGRGSVPRVNEMQRQIDVQKAANDRARQSNARLTSEVHDLKEGLDMVEEKARSELGMVRPNEVYVQFTPRAPSSSAPLSPPRYSISTSFVPRRKGASSAAARPGGATTIRMIWTWNYP